MSKSPFGPAADGPPPDPRERFVCPACGARSASEDDKRFGYCGRCHDYTGIDRSRVQAIGGDDLVAARGAIAGPGGAYDRDAVIVDARKALVLDEVKCFPIAMHGTVKRGSSSGAREVREGYLIRLGGVRAQGDDGTGQLKLDPAHRGITTLVGNADTCAAIVSETMALFARHDAALYLAYMDRVQELLEQYDEEGAGGADGAEYAPQDPGHALLVEGLHVTALTGASDPEDAEDAQLVPGVAWEFGGRLNRTEVRTSSIVIARGSAPAELLARLMLTASRDKEFMALLAARMDTLVAGGAMGEVRRG